MQTHREYSQHPKEQLANDIQATLNNAHNRILRTLAAASCISCRQRASMFAAWSCACASFVRISALTSQGG